MTSTASTSLVDEPLMCFDVCAWRVRDGPCMGGRAFSMHAHMLRCMCHWTVCVLHGSVSSGRWLRVCRVYAVQSSCSLDVLDLWILDLKKKKKSFFRVYCCISSPLAVTKTWVMCTVRHRRDFSLWVMAHRRRTHIRWRDSCSQP